MLESHINCYNQLQIPETDTLTNHFAPNFIRTMCYYHIYLTSEKQFNLSSQHFSTLAIKLWQWIFPFVLALAEICFHRDAISGGINELLLGDKRALLWMLVSIQNSNWNLWPYSDIRDNGLLESVVRQSLFLWTGRITLPKRPWTIRMLCQCGHSNNK